MVSCENVAAGLESWVSQRRKVLFERSLYAAVLCIVCFSGRQKEAFSPSRGLPMPTDTLFKYPVTCALVSPERERRLLSAGRWSEQCTRPHCKVICRTELSYSLNDFESLPILMLMYWILNDFIEYYKWPYLGCSQNQVIISKDIYLCGTISWYDNGWPDSGFWSPAPLMSHLCLFLPAAKPAGQ